MRVFIFLFLILNFTFAQSLEAQLLFDAKEVAQKSKDRYVGDDSSTAFVMELINSKEKVRRREFLRYQKDVEGNKTTLLKFRYPNDIKDTGTLNIEISGEDDTQYLYLPAARKLRRVSSKKQSWVGSDFSYEDLQEIEIDDHVYEALRLETIEGHEAYVYSMVPKQDGDSIYSKQIRWTSKKGYIPLKIEYYDKKGKLLKVMEAKDVRETDQAYYAWDISCRNVQDQHRTEITRLWLLLNTEMDDKNLTTRNLEKSINLYNHPNNLWEVWDESTAQSN